MTAPTQTVRRSAFVWWLSRSLVLAFCRVWHRLRIENASAMPATGPVLVVANHGSYLDPPLIGISCRRWVGFLAQSGLARFGPARWWLRQVGVTLIDRSAPSKDALRLVVGCLEAGEAVGLFPEGTRSRDGAVGPFRAGVEFLVRRTGAPVLPVGLDGAFRAFPRGAWLPRPRRIVVRYGSLWSAERVLAPGGLAALRAEVAALARLPLRSAADDPTALPPTSESAGTGASAPASATGDRTVRPPGL